MRRLLVLLFLVGCGPKTIDHSGYPAGDNKPWAKPKSLKLDERYEAKVDGTASYPKKERARWYVVELPADGKMTATITIDARAPGADLGMEILDAGFNVLSKDADDELQPKKERVADKITGGKAYIHIYTLKRPDEADYTLRLRFAPFLTTTAVTPTVVAVADEIPNHPDLAQVSSTDAKRRPSTGPRPEKPEKPEKPPPAPKGVSARIYEFGIKDGKVHIKIDKGQVDSVEAGWRGYVLSAKSGDKIPGSDFTVQKVKESDCEASVPGITMDVAQQNRGVRLIKPAE
jgi:hypothetical protein